MCCAAENNTPISSQNRSERSRCTIIIKIDFLFFEKLEWTEMRPTEVQWHTRFLELGKMNYQHMR